MFPNLKPDTVYQISVRVKETDDTMPSPASDPTAVRTEKSGVDKPNPPKAEATDTTITVTEPTGDEYEYRKDGGDWQSGPVFPNLKPDTVYQISVRVKETDDTMPSPASDPTAVRTKPNPPKATATDTAITVTEPTGDGYEYSADGGETWQDSPVFPNLTPNTEYPISVRRKAPDGGEPGPASDPTKVKTEESAPNSYTIRFDANGGGGTMPDVKASAGESVTLPENAFVRNGYSFRGWARSATGAVAYRNRETVKDVASQGVTVLYAVWVQGKYQVSGEVTSYRSGAIQLKLVRGRELIGEQNVTMRGASAPYYGEYLFEDVPNGIYNLVGVCEGVTRTAEVIITDSDAIRDFTMPDGDINSILNVKGEDTPAIVVGGLDDEADSYADGAQSVTVTMDLEKTEPKPVGSYDSDDERETQAAIAMIQEQALRDNPESKLEFLNITVNRTRDGVEQRLTQTNVILRLIIPFDMAGRRSVQVYRCHNGAVSRLQAYDERPAGDYQEGRFYADASANLIYVYANRFSVYALSFVDDTPNPETPVYKVFQNLDGSWSEPAQPDGAAQSVYAVRAEPGFHAVAYSLGAYQADEARRSATAEGQNIRPGNYGKLYVYYARNAYTLTFYSDSEGKTALQSETVSYGAPLAQYESVKPADMENYTFAAWSPDKNIQVSAFRDKQGNLTNGVTVIDWTGEMTDDDTKVYRMETMPDKNVNAYPIWIHDRLVVHLDLGAYDSLNHEEWYSSEGLDANTPATMSSEQARQFTVDLNEQVRMGNLVEATREGYQLIGWYTQNGTPWNGEWGVTPWYCDEDENGDDLIAFEDNRKYNYYTVTLTARWAPIKVALAYAGDGEPLPQDDGLYGLGDTIVIGAAPVAPAGKIFSGWRDAKGTLHSPGEHFVFEDWTLQSGGVITLTSAFINAPKATDYAITFDSAGGTPVAPIVNYALNEPIVATTARTGYAFNGWYEGNKLVAFPLVPTVAENRAFTAHWTRNQYTITFKSNGGTAVAPITLPYGTPIDKTAVSTTKTHYTLNGWLPALPDTMPAKDLTVEALWTPTEYALQYRIDGNAPIQTTASAIYGGLVEKPDNPVKAGYTFTGWSPAFPTYMLDDYPLIIGQWTKNPSPVTSSGSSSARTYRIMVEQAENGSAEASASEATSGYRITVTPAPSAGYVTEGVGVRTSGGQSVAVTKRPDGKYSFVMPANDVIVSPSFKTDGGASGETPAQSDDSGVSEWLIADEHPVYIRGFSDGTFRPNDSITRAQTAMMIYRLLKDKDVEKTESFLDMDGTEWYAEAAYVLSSLGVIEGYSDGSFRGQNAITRAAFTAILTRFIANEESVDPDAAQFSDVPPEHWAHDVITKAAFYGWIGGYADGTFQPAAPITRAAASAIINRMLGREADREYVAAHADELQGFSDVRDPDAWYYYNVMEAANEHTFKTVDGKELWNR